MRWIHAALRVCSRGTTEGTPRTNRPRKPRLGFELLEDRLAPAAGTFQSVIGLPTVQALYPYNGKGYAVAILDTGIDYNDTDLGGGFGPGYRVEAGWNFVANNANPMDDNGHGTNIAGIIGSSNASNPGIDPDVNFIDLKVLNSQNTGTWANIDAGLQWVIAHKTQYNIVAVNLSLGAGNYTTDSYDLLETDLATLKNLGVFTAVAAGNSYAPGSLPGLAYPAVDPDVVSVGATWTGNDGAMTWSSGAIDHSSTVDQIVSSSQRDGALDLLAPGAWITSDGLNNTQYTLGGTSMAAAVVSGAAVLLHEAYDATGQSALANQADILEDMQATGVRIVDSNHGTDNVPHTGLTFKRLNLLAAVEAIGEPVPPPVLGPIANQTLPEGQKIVIPLSVSDPAGSPVSITWTLNNLPAGIAPPVVISLSNNILSILATTPWLGTFSGTVSAADPHFTATQTFNVTEVPAPVLAAIPNQTMSHSLHQLTLPLSASESGGATITYSAQVLPTNGQTPPITLALQGNQLTIGPALRFVGTFTVEVSASDGKTTVSKSFTVTVTDSAPVLASIANVTASHGQAAVVTLSATDADGDALAYSAQVLPVSGQGPPLNVSIQGTQLTIPPQSVLGTFTIQVTASDGALTALRTFTITLTNTAPTLGAIATQTMATGHTSLAVPLSAADADHDALTFQAAAVTPSALAYNLEKQFGFKEFDGSYYLNIWGQNEKWLVGNNNVWYMLLPNGNLYRWAQSVAASLVPANLIASLGTAFYAQPALLWNAQPPVSPALTFSFQGNQLTVQRPASLTGVFFINVTVSDGFTTTTQTLELVLN